MRSGDRALRMLCLLLLLAVLPGCVSGTIVKVDPDSADSSGVSQDVAVRDETEDSGDGGDVTGDGGSQDAEEVLAAEVTEEPFNLEPTQLSISATGGFDDFSSPGAAFGYAVDEAQGMILIAALRFDLPLHSKEYALDLNVNEALTGFEVGPVPEVLVDDVAAWPMLAAAITDTAGIRTMAEDAMLILLQGDLTKTAPERIWLASGGGTITLYREDGPKDILEGSASFVEVNGFGQGASSVPAQIVQLAPFYFEWSTEEQP